MTLLYDVQCSGKFASTLGFSQFGQVIKTASDRFTMENQFNNTCTENLHGYKPTWVRYFPFSILDIWSVS